MTASNRTLIKKIFAHKQAALITIFVALLNKLFTAYVYFDLAGDKSIYTMMSLNAISGHGFTETIFLFQQPDHAYHLINSAINSPGYSFILIPFLLITGKNILLSSLCVEGLGWTILLFSVRSVLKQCNCHTYLVNLVILTIGFFLYPHEFVSGPKDTLATGLLWANTAVILSVLTRNQYSFKIGILIGILVMLPGVVKLMYAPLAFSFLLVLPIASWYKKDKKILFTFLWSLFTAVLMFSLLRIWLASLYAGQSILPEYQYWSIVSGANQFTRGFYPGQIQYVFPFLVTAFVDVYFLGVQAEKFFSITYGQAWKSFQLLNAFLFLWLMIRSIWFFSRLRQQMADKKTILIIIGGLVSFSLLAVLIGLSIHLKTIKYKGGGLFTYAADGRAYLYIIIFAQLLFFIFLFQQKFRRNSFYFWLKRILTICLVLSVTHRVYSTTKNIFQVDLIQEKNRNLRSHPILEIVAKEQKERPGKNVRLITQMQHLRWIGLLHGDTIYSNPANLEKHQIYLPENLVFITAVFKEDTTLLRRYMQQPDVKVMQVHNEIILLMQE